MTGPTPPDLFDPRTSVILSGNSRPLLNWVAYALVANHPGGFLWGHVRLEDEVLEENDPLKTPIIPRERLISVSPDELVPDDFRANVALGGLARSDAEEDSVRKFADFLRLPDQTQRLISELPREGPAPVLVLSGAHRVAPLYTPGAVGPTLRRVIEFGGSVLIVWAEARVEARFQFDRVLHLTGDEPKNWRDAVLTVEKGWPTGPLMTGAKLRLGDMPSVASVLGRNL